MLRCGTEVQNRRSTALPPGRRRFPTITCAGWPSLSPIPRPAKGVAASDAGHYSIPPSQVKGLEAVVTVQTWCDMDSFALWQGESPHLNLPPQGEEAEPPPSSLNTYKRSGAWAVPGQGRPEIHHLIWTGGVLDCFRGCDSAPCRGWIPAFAGMTEVGDFGRPVLYRLGGVW